jgi:hypothetical protein
VRVIRNLGLELGFGTWVLVLELGFGFWVEQRFSAALEARPNAA